AVDERDPYLDHGLARDRPLGHGIDDALLDRGAEVLGDGAAEDLVLPDEALATGRRRHLDGADRVLAVPARLLDVAALDLGGARDGLPVGDLRHLAGRLDA